MKGHDKDSLELKLRLSGGRMCERLQVIKADLTDDDRITDSTGRSQLRNPTQEFFCEARLSQEMKEEREVTEVHSNL